MLRRGVGIAWAIGLTALATAALAHVLTGRPFDDFASEPASMLDQPPYIGFVSTLGGFVWWTPAVVAALLGLLLRYQGESSRGARLLGIGCACAYLGLDDVFLIHDGLLPPLGVPEKLTYATYAAVVLSYLVADRRFVRRTPTWLLIIAGGLFAGSIVADQTPRESLPLPFAFEDSAKLMGIVTFAVWVIAVALSEYVPTLRADSVDQQTAFRSRAECGSAVTVAAHPAQVHSGAREAC